MSLLPGDKRAEHKRERWPRDWYVEPYEAIETLFNTVMFEDPVLHDPCCGEGRIPIVAARYGYEVTGSDLVYRGFGTGGIDFLEDWTPRATLVFNPPGGKGRRQRQDPRQGIRQQVRPSCAAGGAASRRDRAYPVSVRQVAREAPLSAAPASVDPAALGTRLDASGRHRHTGQRRHGRLWLDWLDPWSPGTDHHDLGGFKAACPLMFATRIRVAARRDHLRAKPRRRPL